MLLRFEVVTDLALIVLGCSRHVRKGGVDSGHSAAGKSDMPGSRSGPRCGLPSSLGAAIRVLGQESNINISFLVNLAELSILFCATHLLRSILWVSLVPLSPLEWIVRKC